MSAGRPPDAVLLDCFGTIVGLDPPLPRLTARMAAEGYEYPPERLAAALDAEMRFYRANHDDGRDAASLAALRRACAGVLGEGLGQRRPESELLTRCLLDSLEFVLLPDAVPALDALREQGHRLAVVSNWDYDLPSELERLGIADRFEVVAVSAAVGARKPAPAIFHHALQRLGVDRERAVHCGDQPEPDCLGACQAGLRAILIDRDGRHPDAPCRRIGALTDLPAALLEPDRPVSRSPAVAGRRAGAAGASRSGRRPTGR